MHFNEHKHAHYWMAPKSTPHHKHIKCFIFFSSPHIIIQMSFFRLFEKSRAILKDFYCCCVVLGEYLASLSFPVHLLICSCLHKSLFVCVRRIFGQCIANLPLLFHVNCQSLAKKKKILQRLWVWQWSSSTWRAENPNEQCQRQHDAYKPFKRIIISDESYYFDNLWCSLSQSFTLRSIVTPHTTTFRILFISLPLILLMFFTSW